MGGGRKEGGRGREREREKKGERGGGEILITLVLLIYMI